MRLPLVLVLMSVASLAGCADADAPRSDGEGDGFEEFETTVTEDTGIIRGVVVTPAIAPVEGAKVTVEQTGQEVRTNADGAFVVGGLDPGTYFLKADAVGFKPVQTSVEVVAGVEKPPVVKVLLDFDPAGIPYYTAIQWDSYIECSTSVVAACAVLAMLGVSDDDFDNIWDLEPGMDRLQTEMVWESTQPAGANMYYTHRYGTLEDYDQGFYSGGFNSTEGPSPLLQVTHGEQADEVELGVEEEFQVAIFSGAADNVPVLGVTLSQELTIFMHIFYGYEPPDGWRFTSDGAPPAPDA